MSCRHRPETGVAPVQSGVRRYHRRGGQTGVDVSLVPYGSTAEEINPDGKT